MGKLFEVAQTDEVPPGSAVVVDAGGVEIALVNSAGSFYAIDNECTHAAGNLGEGELVDERTLECPLHGSQFDITTGEVVQGPADAPVKSYPVTVEGGVVKVEIE
jgi:3-phenylpropionate/trans-cinnamate dioxygenase ferredoxin component